MWTWIEPLAGSADRQPPGFNVSVTFDNPQLAQQICRKSSMLMSGTRQRAGAIEQGDKIPDRAIG
jgi:hypothetical protein